jgi:hypothetical protein
LFNPHIEEIINEFAEEELDEDGEGDQYYDYS